jgi:hypothetical protein
MAKELYEREISPQIRGRVFQSLDGSRNTKLAQGMAESCEAEKNH